MVFAAQNLFFGLPLTATTVILSTISIGLFGYGLAGVLRPIAVWHVDAVYWSTLPVVKTLQGKSRGEPFSKFDLSLLKYYKLPRTTSFECLLTSYQPRSSLAKPERKQVSPSLLVCFRGHVHLRVLPCLHVSVAQLYIYSVSSSNARCGLEGIFTHKCLWRVPH